jgi:Uma2 family endonuclease
MTIAQSKPESLSPLRWSRAEYYQLGEQGHFAGKRVMLIDGEIIQMPGQKEPHAWTITILNQLLVKLVDPEFVVRCQLPLDLSEFSEPEPDFAIVHGPLDAWRGKPHPALADWIIEVSDTTLAFDQTAKQSLYASHGVLNYWIVNLIDRRLEVHALPVRDSSLRFGWRYQSVQYFSADDVVPLPLKPGMTLRVGQVLP